MNVVCVLGRDFLCFLVFFAVNHGMREPAAHYIRRLYTLVRAHVSLCMTATGKSVAAIQLCKAKHLYMLDKVNSVLYVANLVCMCISSFP